MKKSYVSSRILGFTLLELLVVMAILGILAAIGMASYTGVQAKARDARRKSDLENIARAMEMYYNDNGNYPASLPPNRWEDGGALYMEKVPQDTRGNYFYEQVTIDGVVGKGYRLYARLENVEDQKAARTTAPSGPGAYQGISCGAKLCNYVIMSTSVKDLPTVVVDS